MNVKNVLKTGLYSLFPARIRNVLETNVDFLLPKYTEIDLFLLSLIIFLSFISDQSFRESVIMAFFFHLDGGTIVALILFILGIIFSIYFTFVDDNIPVYIKGIVLFFAVSTNVCIGISAGYYMLENSHSLNLIFPLMNISNSIFLLIVYRAGALNENAISDIQAKRSEVIISSIAMVIIFIYSKYVLNNYWAITFSICLVYASNIKDLIKKVIIRN